MPFMTILFIASFCFVFYIIWHQFLKKDARLSVGLKVLQKKMNMIESFSKQTDLQLSKGIDLLDQKNRELEKIVNEARFCIFKMEKMISRFESKNLKLVEEQPAEKNKMTLVKKQDGSDKEKSQPVRLVTNKETSERKKMKIDFGESPFSSLSFKEDNDKEKPSSTPLEQENPQDLL